MPPPPPVSAPLILRLEPHSNTLWFGDVAVRGRHRWETALLAQLALRPGVSPQHPCHAAELNQALTALGQRVALNRKQLSRLSQSLAELFAQQGQDFDLRWRHAPRARTVGPWWWQPQPGDRVRLAPGAAGAWTVPKPAPAVPRVLPSLSKEPSLPALLAMCSMLLAYQPKWEGGPYEAVLPALQDDDAWRGASAEMLAYRWLQTASSHLHTRRLDDAHASWKRAQRILAREPIAAAYLGLWSTTVRAGLLRIDPKERRRAAGAEQLQAALGLMPGVAHPEADRLSRLFLFAFDAIAEVGALRRALRRPSQDDLALQHGQRAVALFSASLFCAFTGRHFDHMKSVLAHLGAFAHTLLEAGMNSDVAMPLQWYMLANQMRHKLGLVDDTWLITTGLGHCWLSAPGARAAFATLCQQTPWAGARPDELMFYTSAADETRLIGDPRYFGKALINLVSFAREQRLNLEYRRARQELQRLFVSQPGLAELFEAEGWPALKSVA